MNLTTGISIALLLLAALIEFWVDQKSPAHIYAEKHIGECKLIEFAETAAYRSANKTAIFIQCKGVQGPISGMLIIAEDNVEELIILKSKEGSNRSKLNDPVFLATFQQLVHEPLNVDAIAGATVSSQIVMDEVSKHLKELNKKDS